MRKLTKLCLILMSSVLLIGCEQEISKVEEIPTYSFDTTADNQPLVIENDKLKFTLDPNTTYFEVINKKNNSVWKSNPDNAADDPMADGASKNYMQSPLIIEYTNNIGVKVLYSTFDKSIQKTNYQVSQNGDTIQVDYTLGDFKKIFYIPPAMPESRMATYLEQMDSSAQRKVKSYYRRIDINNLLPDDDKGELLEKYPELENEKVYVIRTDVQNHLKTQMEGFFRDAGYTLDDYHADMEKYAKDDDEELPYFNVSIIYRLEDEDLVVEVPFEKMMWKEGFPITKVKVLPYFGAGSTADEGYLMVPEGNGAVINFNNGKAEQNFYYSDVYGYDFGMERDSMTDENDIAFPVFGIAKNGNALLCILEDYAPVAGIEADVSGNGSSYNYVNATYTTIHYSSLKVSAKTDKSVIMFEKRKPEGSLKQRYRFIESDSYIKMAESYRDYLTERYPKLTKKDSSSTPVNVALIGAIDKDVQRVGIPLSLPTELTSFKEAYDLLDELLATGYKNLSIKYRGWLNEGVRHSALAKVKHEKELGSEKDLIRLINHANELNVPLYLEGTVQTSYNYGWFDGFMVNRDAVKTAGREILELNDFTVFYSPLDWFDCYYLLKPAKTVEYMQNLANYVKAKKAGVSFYDVGHTVSGSYDPKNLVTRQESLEMQRKQLAAIDAEGTKILINNGNDYALPYADIVTNMDLSGSQYMLIDYMIPFYSMAIHGLIDYTGEPINLSPNSIDLVLKSAETGAGLSFAFMKESTSALQETGHTYFFGADYDKWKDEAYSIYSRYEAELGHVFNQYITNHEYFKDGVFATTYEDGTKVYVNYTNYDYEQDGIKVPAKDYVVERR